MQKLLKNKKKQLLSLFALLLVSSCAYPNFPDIRICTIIDTGDVSTAYGFCPRALDQSDIARPKLSELMKGRYECVSPDDYALLMQYVDDLRRETNHN